MAFQMGDLEGALPEYDFVYANAAYSDGAGGYLWILDPPGGKDDPTTDPDFAADSVQTLDEIVETQGPFAGIVGYSQGAAFVPVYLANAQQNTFDFAIMFCGCSFHLIPSSYLVAFVKVNSPLSHRPLFTKVSHVYALGDHRSR